MILVVMIFIGLLAALASGGSVGRLKTERLRGETALLALLPAQILWPALSRAAGLSCQVSISVWLTMMAGLVLILARNVKRRLPLGLAALGVAANLLVIALNGAMPVSLAASSELGLRRVEARRVLVQDCLHEEITGGTRLPWMADVIAVPGPDWLSAVISPGDLLLGGGLALWIFSASRER